MNKELHIEVGHTIKEWQEKFGADGDLWDVSIEDISSGAIEPNSGCWYWLIDGRLYETWLLVE